MLTMLRALLLVVLASACCRCEPVVDPQYCATAGPGYHCAHCMQPLYCGSDGSLTLYDQCTLGAVCELFDGTAVCVTMDEAGRCWCNSNFCDAYNMDYLDMCNGEGIYDIIECAEVDPSFTCNHGECALSPTTTPLPPPFSCYDPDALVAAWNPVYPECQTAYYCTENLDQLNTTCPDGYYVDQNGNCQLPPPEPCAYSCEGYCPDETDCSQYYACDGAGGVIAGPFQCDSGLYFDPNDDPPFCSGTDDSVCTPVSKCDL